MNGLFAILMSLVILGTPRVEGTDDEILARYEKECAVTSSNPECDALSDEIELMLYSDLRLLFRLGEEIDPDIIGVAVSARLPQLVLLGLYLMGAQPAAQDLGAILSALESSSPAVREEALSLLGDQAPAEVQSLAEWVYFGQDGEDDGLVPDAKPDADLLGFPPYPGARLVPLASGKTRAFFVTTAAPEKVIATIAKGHVVLESFELYERLNALMMPPEYEALVAELEQLLAAEEFERIPAIQAEMEEIMKPAAQVGVLMGDLGQAMLRPDARFVIVREKPAATMGATPAIGRIAAVFRDDNLDATVILVPLR
jgi:hypothetical protein